VKQSQKIILTILFITLSILIGTILTDPMMVYGQTTKQISISRETGRDPFILPPGIHLLSREKTTSEPQKVSSKDIAPLSLRVNAILISDHIRLASMGGNIVTVGDEIQGEKILEIKKDRVILGKGDKKRTLLLSQSPVQVKVEEK